MAEKSGTSSATAGDLEALYDKVRAEWILIETRILKRPRLIWVDAANRQFTNEEG